MSNHKVGDIVYDPDNFELGFILKIWSREEIINNQLDYVDFLYELYFPETGTHDRFKESSVIWMKRSLDKVLNEST